MGTTFPVICTSRPPTMSTSRGLDPPHVLGPRLHHVYLARPAHQVRHRRLRWNPRLSTSSSTTSPPPLTTLPMPSSSSLEEVPLGSTTSSTPGTTTLPTVPRREQSTLSPALSSSTLFDVVVVRVCFKPGFCKNK